MRVRWQTKPAAWLGVLLCLVSLSAPPARAQAETALLIEPAAASLAPGESVRLALAVNEASDVYGFEVRIQFDPAVVQVVDQDPDTPGIQVAAGDFLDPNEGFLVANQADNGTGEITYAFTLLLPATPKQGDGDLISFEVQAVAAGQSQIRLESAILSTTDGESLPFSARGGQVTVAGEGAETPTGLPPSSTPAGTPGESSPTATSPPIAPTGTPAEGVPTATPGEALPTTGLTPTLQPSATQDGRHTATVAPGSPSPTDLAVDEATATAIAAVTAEPSPSPTRTTLAVPVARATGPLEEEQPPSGLGAWWLWAAGLLVLLTGLLLVAGLVFVFFLRARRGQEAE